MHARIQKVFLGGGVQLWQRILLFFLVDEGRENPNTTLRGPSFARQRNKMAFRWRANDGPTLNAGLKALWFSGDPDQYY